MRFSAKFDAKPIIVHQYVQTSTHVAADDSHLDIIQLLLDQGADLIIQDNNERTPTHIAIINGHLEIVQLLLD